MTMSLGHNVSECAVVYFGLVSQKRNLQCTSKEKVQDSVAKKIIKSPQKNMTKIINLPKKKISCGRLTPLNLCVQWYLLTLTVHFAVPQKKMNFFVRTSFEYF